jgi:iron complex outermembrane receptor protein
MRKFLAQCAAVGLVAVTTLGSSVGAARAQDAVASADLADLSLEELMNIEVYSAAKKTQKLSDSAAAAYVLTQEDIRRSGVTSVPEALRLVPGVEVAHIDANKWAITIRGFNDRFANKLLVLIDGRSVYTPLFAGVYWDIQDLVLEDIDRIEVIRGPGGTLWGANAVNGVINILTKKAKDTQGALFTTGAGTEERAFGTVRYGAKIGRDAYTRVFGKYFARDSFESTRPATAGKQGSDQWDLGHAGFRTDWDPNEKDSLTLQGDFYDGKAGSYSTVAAPPPVYVDSQVVHQGLIGGNVLGRWTHQFSSGSEARLQAYYDRTDRDSSPVYLGEERNTADLDFQHRFKLGGRHDFVWGLGYRITWDDLTNQFPITFKPDNRSLNLFNAFIQDEISFLHDSVRLTLGTKLEHNDYTGFEVQPNVRALWKPTDRQSVWGAISRAVRTPSRAEDDIRINSAVIPAGFPNSTCAGSPLDCVVSMFGRSSFNSEKLVAFELGYRQQLLDNAGIDIATFYNIYDDLRTIEPKPAKSFVEADPAPPHVVIPIEIGNGLRADTYGVEIAADWRPFDFWKLRSGYTFFEMDLNFNGASQADPLSGSADGASPQNQLFLRSLIDLPYHLELDSNLKWVDDLKSLGVGDYASLDLRLGWRPTEMLEFSLVGQNLLYKSNQEFDSSAFVNDEPTKVERGVYGKVTVKF